MYEQLPNLEVGDKVIVLNRYHRWVDKVARTTKTQIVTKKNGFKFKKSNGRLVGGSGWDVLRIEIATLEKIKEIEYRDRRLKLLHIIDKADYDVFSNDGLESIVSAINLGEKNE